MEKAERKLGGFVQGHLMLILAALLGEGTDPLMNPFVAVNLGLLRRDRGCSNDLVDVFLYVVLVP